MYLIVLAHLGTRVRSENPIALAGSHRKTDLKYMMLSPPKKAQLKGLPPTAMASTANESQQPIAIPAERENAMKTPANSLSSGLTSWGPYIMHRLPKKPFVNARNAIIKYGKASFRSKCGSEEPSTSHKSRAGIKMRRHRTGVTSVFGPNIVFQPAINLPNKSNRLKLINTAMGIKRSFVIRLLFPLVERIFAVMDGKTANVIVKFKKTASAGLAIFFIIPSRNVPAGMPPPPLLEASFIAA